MNSSLISSFLAVGMCAYFALGVRAFADEPNTSVTKSGSVQLTARDADDFSQLFKRSNRPGFDAFYYFEDVQLLPGTDIIVAQVRKVVFETGTPLHALWELPFEIVAVVAARLNGDKLGFVTLDQRGSSIHFITGGQAWTTGSYCITITKMPDRSMLSADNMYDTSRHREYWEYIPERNEVAFASAAIPVGSLSRALAPSNLRLTYDSPHPEAWNGDVVIRGNDWPPIQFRCANSQSKAKEEYRKYRAMPGFNESALVWPGGPELAYWDNQQFVSAGKDSVLEINRFPALYSGIRIRRLKFTKHLEVKWSLEQSAIESDINSRLTDIACVRGVFEASNPIPLYMGVAGRDEFIWFLDVDAKKFVWAVPVPTCNYSSTSFVPSKEARDICASPNGQRVVFRLTSREDNVTQLWLCDFKERSLSQVLRTAAPLAVSGVTDRGLVIIANGQHVLLLSVNSLIPAHVLRIPES